MHLVKWRDLAWFWNTLGKYWLHYQRNFTENVLVIGMYLFIINNIFNKKRIMYHIIRNLHASKSRLYAVSMVEPNVYLAVFLGLDTGKFFCDAELNAIMLHTMTNGWGKNYFFQGLILGRWIIRSNQYVWTYMGIEESIYEGVVETSTKY